MRVSPCDIGKVAIFRGLFSEKAKKSVLAHPGLIQEGTLGSRMGPGRAGPLRTRDGTWTVPGSDPGEGLDGTPRDSDRLPGLPKLRKIPAPIIMRSALPSEVSKRGWWEGVGEPTAPKIQQKLSPRVVFSYSYKVA